MIKKSILVALTSGLMMTFIVPNVLAANPTIVNTASGLKYIDIKKGEGETPKQGQTVVVHYVGTLDDGTQFDSSYDRKEPFEFTIGAGEVIKGWDLGIATMSVGGERDLIIPASLGYGSEGAGGAIPPNSTLHFNVKLIKIKD